MRQPNGPYYLLWHSQDIPQDVDLKLIKRLIDRRLQQCLKLLQPILDFQPRLGVLDISVLVCVRNRRVGVVLESEFFRWSVEKPVFETRDSLVDEIVYGVDYVVDEGLRACLSVASQSTMYVFVEGPLTRGV